MKTIQLNEYNIRLGRNCYLPVPTGSLRAYAEQEQVISDEYSFNRFLYHIDTPVNILKAYDDPVDVAAFSVSVWNEQLNLAVAAEVKRRYPKCLIVFGGLQVPDDATDYLKTYPFIDVAIRRAGEVPFAAVLKTNLTGRDFSQIPQVTCRLIDGSVVCNNVDEPFKKDLDELPSPALEGLFDYLMPLHGREVEFSMVLEADRGCPFMCQFCEYGLGQHKMSYYAVDRVKAEIDWAAKNRISYLLGSSANFGMATRDMEIAEYLVATKKKYGYPDKFRVNYGKNTTDKIYQVAKLLHEADMTKSVTLARQSNDPQVLKNIKRSNIKMSTYQELQTRFNDDGVPTYSEFIMGLPGETYESWVRGLDEVVEAGMKNQVIIYPLTALPNTDMGRVPYQTQYKIKTRRIEMAEVHGTVRGEDYVPEYENIVVSTESMPVDEWRKVAKYSWIYGALHGMKLGYFIILYLLHRWNTPPSRLIETILDDPIGPWANEIAFYDKVLDGVLERGQPMASILPGYGNVYYSGEEATFLRVASGNLDEFYDAMFHLVVMTTGCDSRFNASEFAGVVSYQQMRIPSPNSRTKRQVFKYNYDSYFEACNTSRQVDLILTNEAYQTQPVDYEGNTERFAREVVVQGRKSGKILVPVEVV